MSASAKKRIHLPCSEETKNKIGIANSGRITPKEVKERISRKLLGGRRSEESRIKQGNTNRGKKRPAFSEKWKNNIREYVLSHPNRVFKDTKIELKIEEELKKRGIVYEKQVPLCKIALVDFYLSDYKIVIQCDGCYYHNCLEHYPNEHKESRIRCSGQDVVLKSNGFKVYRFWEHEINKSAEECINEVFKLNI